MQVLFRLHKQVCVLAKILERSDQAVAGKIVEAVELFVGFLEAAPPGGQCGHEWERLVTDGAKRKHKKNGNLKR